MVDGPRNDSVKIDGTPEDEPKKSIDINHNTEKNKGKEKVNELVAKKIPRPPLPLSQTLRKKQEKGRDDKFLSMLKELSVNIYLIEALEQMLGYTKFIKDLVT